MSGQPELVLINVVSTDSGLTPASQLAQRIEQFSNLRCIVAQEEGQVRKQIHAKQEDIWFSSQTSTVGRLRRLFDLGFRISKKLRQLRGHGAIFALGAQMLPGAISTAKLLGMRPIVVLTGSPTNSMRARGESGIWFASALGFFSQLLATQIVVYSPSLVSQLVFRPFRQKTSIGWHHAVAARGQYGGVQLHERQVELGFAGRFSEEKGFREFMLAAVKLAKRGSTNIQIAGAGELEGWARELVAEAEVASQIQFMGWLSKEAMGAWLDDLKILIMPSRTEGLPNLALEAMARGVILLAACVGAIPDVIEDGVTGFILEDVAPQAILEAVMRLNQESLDNISLRAAEQIENRFGESESIASLRRALLC